MTDADHEHLRGHGFSDEDIWDIGGITAFFAPSNRMAHLIDMRANDEFYLMGRIAARAEMTQLQRARAAAGFTL